MPTYVYETTDAVKPPRRFEVKQSMNDAPLKFDPRTGERVQRVISGGFGVMQKGASAAAPAASCHRPGSCGCH